MADDRDDTAQPNSGENAGADKAANPSGIPGTANPGTQTEPPYQIMRQYVKDFSFENPNAPQIFEGTGAPQPRLSIDVQTNGLSGRDVEVILHVEAQAEKDGKTAYVLELDYACIVRVGQIPKEALGALLYVEVPRMIFPFVREVVCNATHSGGFSMLLLAPFDFTQLYRARLAEEQQKLAAQQQAEAGEGPTDESQA